jgi:hypothetical protein
MPFLPLAAFTFGDATLTVIELAFMFLWIWIAIGVVFDVFRSPDLTNGRKALWVLWIVVFPYVGVFGYLIIRGHNLHEHQAQDHAQYAAFRQYQRRSASGHATDDISTLTDLRDRGVLSSDEFEQAKAKAVH